MVSMRVFIASVFHCYFRFSRFGLLNSTQCPVNHLVRRIGLACQQASRAQASFSVIYASILFLSKGVMEFAILGEASSTGFGARIIALAPEAQAGCVRQCNADWDTWLVHGCWWRRGRTSRRGISMEGRRCTGRRCGCHWRRGWTSRRGIWMERRRYRRPRGTGAK